MPEFTRYAVYYAPEPGPLADFAASWLGWDPVAGAERARPAVPGLQADIPALTAEAHKYGFHGTLKPPFRLAEGCDEAALIAAVDALGGTLAPIEMPALALRRIGRFLALTPEGDTAPLMALAARVVEALDPFRAPMTAADRARRHPEKLSPAQVALLDRWGYPYVMDEFRFHLTLTGKLTEAEAEAVRAALAPVLAPLLPVPFRIASLCVFGEAADGRFHLVHRSPLI